MLIGNSDFFTRNHIENHRHHTSLVLAEQVIHSMELVALLAHEGLDFMFKGGNSLLILLEEPKRFSIDVDIATDSSKERIEEVLDNLVEKSDVFIRWEKRPHKTKPWLPMTSYYIFYNSLFTDPKETSIMLDAQLKMSLYKKINKPVCCGTFYSSKESVLLPSPSSLIGDKLLTLGPKTLGIPLNKGKEAQRLKHSFDVSLLASKTLNIEEIRESVRLCMEQENTLQRTSFGLDEIFDDTIAYCGSVVKYEKEPGLDGLSPCVSEIVRGRIPFQSHIFSGDYSWEDLKLDFARVAVCMTAVVCDKISSRDLTSVLNSREKTPYYWNKITEWLGRNPL